MLELLLPELRKRDIVAPEGDSGTMREHFDGKGQTRLENVELKFK